MRKLLFLLMLSTVVTITSACGSDKQDTAAVEDLGVISNKTVEDTAESASSFVEEEEVATSEEKDDVVEEADAEEPEEKVEEESVDPADVVYPAGYAPSESVAFSTGDIIGEYTSDNGNVYSVNFYTSGEDERVGIIYLNRDTLNGGYDESDEIVAHEPNVYMVYQSQNAFVFDYDGDYKLSYYKEGKLWDSAVMTKHYQPS